MTPATPLSAALTYASQGWQVLPLNWPTATGCSCLRGDSCASPGKHPWRRWRESGGITDPGLIRWCWRKQPDSGVAILTGAERSGLFVVDIDPGHGGGDTLNRLEHEHGQLPDTLTAVTGSGGQHLVYNHPGVRARQTAGTIGAGIDTRSDGGLIVAAPSLHRSGRRYTWANWGTPPADVPDWLLDLVQPKTPPPQPTRLPAATTARGARYAEAALERASDEVRRAAPGQRNQTLNRAAWSIGRLVGAGLISADRVGHALAQAATDAGLGVTETEGTIISGLTCGSRQPRQVPA